jgi:hypothetical protein
MYTIYSNRGTGKRKRFSDKCNTREAYLLPGMGYRTDEDVREWVKVFKAINPGLQVRVRGFKGHPNLRVVA